MNTPTAFSVTFSFPNWDRALEDNTPSSQITAYIRSGQYLKFFGVIYIIEFIDTIESYEYSVDHIYHNICDCNVVYYCYIVLINFITCIL